jgi:PIN domain nuclease of toxin-antitoxin system
MSAIVIDTHAAVWHIADPSKLSAAAKAAVNAAATAGEMIYLASISLVEVRYLVEKSKLPPVIFDRLEQALNDPAMALRLVALDHPIARNLRHIPRDQVPDMPDRIIAATALTLSLPLVSRDRKIQSTALATIW